MQRTPKLECHVTGGLKNYCRLLFVTNCQKSRLYYWRDYFGRVERKILLLQNITLTSNKNYWYTLPSFFPLLIKCERSRTITINQLSALSRWLSVMTVKRREMSCSKRLGPRKTQYANSGRWRERAVLCRTYLSKVISLNSTIKSRWESEGVRKCIIYTAAQVTVLGPHRHIVFTVHSQRSTV